MVHITIHARERLIERYDSDGVDQLTFVNRARHKGKQYFEVTNKKLANHIKDADSNSTAPSHVVKYYKHYIFVFGKSIMGDHFVLISMWKLWDWQISEWGITE